MHIKYSTESFALHVVVWLCVYDVVVNTFDSFVAHFMLMLLLLLLICCFFLSSFEIIISAAWCLQRPIAFVAILSVHIKMLCRMKRHILQPTATKYTDTNTCDENCRERERGRTNEIRMQRQRQRQRWWWPQKYRSRHIAFANVIMLLFICQPSVHTATVLLRFLLTTWLNWI